MSTTSEDSSSQRLLEQCCYCGFLNYDDSLSCRACARATDFAIHSNSENDSFSECNTDSVTSDCESSENEHWYYMNNQMNETPTPTPSNGSDFGTFIPEPISKETPKTNVMSFIANDSISYESNSEIFVSNIPEEMANEELGSSELFGKFGDIKQINIIRSKFWDKPTAKITFYSINSIVQLIKLSIAYDNHLTNSMPNSNIN